MVLRRVKARAESYKYELIGKMNESELISTLSLLEIPHYTSNYYDFDNEYAGNMVVVPAHDGITDTTFFFDTKRKLVNITDY